MTSAVIHTRNFENTDPPHATRQSMIDRIAARFRQRGRVRTAPPAIRHSTQKRNRLKGPMKALLCASLSYFALLVGASYFSTALDVISAESSRHLTAGEAAFVQSIFGPDLNTADIKLRFHRNVPRHFHGDARAGSLAFVAKRDPYNIHFVQGSVHAHDYSRADDTGYRGGVFLHEITHVWQFTQNEAFTACDIYEYKLTPDSRFEDFCLEQQGEIIRDYAMRFVIPAHPRMEANAKFDALFREMGHTWQKELSSQEALLAHVVEQKFPHAVAARLRIQASFNTAGACALHRLRADPSLGHQEHFNACAALHVRTINGETLSVSAQQPVLPAASTKRATASGPTS